MEQSQITGGIGGAAQGAKIGSMILPGWGTAIGAVVGGVAGIFGGGGESEAERLAMRQAQAIKMEGRQNMRQMRLQQSQEVGLSRALVGQSNVLFSGSSSDYIRAQNAEFEKQIGWQRTKTKMEAEMAMKGGSMAADQIKTAGISSMISGIGSFASYKASTKKAANGT